MNYGRSSYDPEVQMFKEPAHEPNMTRLRFMRWLAEHGQLEHAVAGQPSGELVLELEEVGV